jgi:hypothetical protein
MVFDFVSRRAINPASSRLRSVLVIMRCEMLPSWRRKSPCRQGLSLSENKILGVHLPIKIGVVPFDPCIVFIFLPGRSLCSRYDRVLGGHVQILMQGSNNLGVTSVAGFRWIR